MITLRIFLIGLIALVPDFGHGTLKVVLQDVRETHSPHYAMIVYECKNLPDEESRKTCGTVTHNGLSPRVLSYSSKFDYRLLDHEFVRLSGAVPGFLTFKRGSRKGQIGSGITGSVPRNREEAQDFSWVPEMAKISPRHSKINNDLLGEGLGGQIAAVIDLRNAEGSVSVFGLVDIDQEVRSFTFKRRASDSPLIDNRQALADVTLIEIAVPLFGEDIEKAPSVTFNVKGRHGKSSNLELALAPYEKSIDVVIGNLAPFLKRGNACDAPEPIFDEHFEFYYELAAAPPPEYREAEIPFKGRKKAPKMNLEYPPPPIVDFIGTSYCSRQVGDGFPSSSNRPICTQVVFEQ